MGLNWTEIIIAALGVLSVFLTYLRGEKKKKESWVTDIQKSIADETEAREAWQEDHVCNALKVMEEIRDWQEEHVEAHASQDAKLDERRRRDLRGRILDIHNRAIEREGLGFKDWENAHEHWDEYKELNGNSFVDELIENIDKMHNGTFDYEAFKGGKL